MSWLGDKLKKVGIRFDSHTLGNLVKNVSPALAFTPVGAVGAGLAATAGGLARGESIGEAAKSGLKNAAVGGTAKAASGVISKALAQGAPSVGGGTVYSSVPGGGWANAASGAPVHGVDLSSVGGGGIPGSGFLSKAGGFIEKHPTAAAMGLQSIGNLATSGAANRAQNAQTTLLEQQAAENAYEMERRKKRDLELAPLFGQLGAQLGQNIGAPVAPNPYASTYGG